MKPLLSDGRLVPETVSGWAGAMGVTLAALAREPLLSDLGDLRKLLQHRPIHYLGSDWEQLVANARAYIDAVEKSLWPLPHGGVIYSLPLEPAKADLRVVA
ncbi:MAG: hypothetical protein B7Y35_06020 [Sphingomonadales bacterium 28-64-96]|nr:MAG: hypothetical protein B7Y35_06020 [Sphingomonadales bacterium 28-64-96]